MSNLEQTCMLCGGTNSDLLYIGDALTYVICEGCSLVYLSPRPTPEEYDAFYKESYQKHRHAITNYEQAVEIRKQKGLRGKEHYLKDFEPYIKSHSRVFEIGCGWGTFLKLIENTYHAHVEGIEPGELASRVARDYFGLSVQNVTLDEYVQQNKQPAFDAVVLMHVLEHFTDPETALQKIKELLRKNGILYIAVPNVASPNEPLDRYFHFEHVNYFSPFTLAKLLEKCGFKVLWNENTHEIKMIVALLSHPQDALDSVLLEAQYPKEKISRAISRQRTKYKVLRVLKGLSKRLLPEHLYQMVRSAIVSVLKKCGIVKI